ncbi:hypothetical protein ACSBR2_032503 [Camellia fascicularis]
MKLLWAICKKSNILWVKWIHTYIIKSKCFRTMQVPSNVSLTVRKLFSLRREAIPLIKKVIGNGESTFLWLENWHSLGPLYLRFGGA